MSVEDLAETRADSPLDAVADLVESFGAYARPLRHAIALLTENDHTVESLVVNTTLPRRTADRLVRDLGGDVSRHDDAVSIRADRVGVYRKRFGYDELQPTRLGDLLAERSKGH